MRGVYWREKCIYPDRWSVEHGQCERFHFVSCGKRIPKNHPCKYISSSHKRIPKIHPCKYIFSSYKPHEISISGVAYLVSPDVSELMFTRRVHSICRNYLSDRHFIFRLVSSSKHQHRIQHNASSKKVAAFFSQVFLSAIVFSSKIHVCLIPQSLHKKDYQFSSVTKTCLNSLNIHSIGRKRKNIY